MALREVVSEESLAGIMTVSWAFTAGAIRYALLERKRRQKAEYDAAHDPLTGLHNRRALDAKFTELRAARQSGDTSIQPTVLLIDLDHFKRINDQQGHSAGDATLREVADIMQESVRSKSTDRPADFAFRHGGEEFGLILPATNVEDAVLLADSLRETFVTRANISATIGVGPLDLSQPLAVSTDPVDAALYVGKRNGRNQTVTVDHPEVQLQLKKLP